MDTFCWSILLFNGWGTLLVNFQKGKTKRRQVSQRSLVTVNCSLWSGHPQAGGGESTPPSDLTNVSNPTLKTIKQRPALCFPNLLNKQENARTSEGTAQYCNGAFAV